MLILTTVHEGHAFMGILKNTKPKIPQLQKKLTVFLPPLSDYGLKFIQSLQVYSKVFGNDGNYSIDTKLCFLLDYGRCLGIRFAGSGTLMKWGIL